jgi:RNA polymerase sigma factor (sigma-70 family)
MHVLTMAPGEPDGVVTLPIDMAGALVADTALGSVPAEWDADQALTAIYIKHYRTLVRMTAFLVRDTATAEEVVQDSFVAMHQGWRRLGTGDQALSYLRHAVVDRSRSVLRRSTVVNRHPPGPWPEGPDGERGAVLGLGHSAVLAALGGLPAPQQEAVVLLYYGGLSEDQAAEAMGVGRGAVQRYAAQAIAALGAVLEQQK